MCWPSWPVGQSFVAGADAGVSHTTARQWLTVLETSYIIFQLPPYHANIRKRLVKSPKLYFYDVGLASYLIGIEHALQIATHPLRGALFENVVVAETLKHRFNRGRQSNLSFFRDARGLECDLLYETGYGMGAVEIKAGATITSSYFQALNRISALIPEISAKAVVYGGTTRQLRSDCEVVPLDDLGGVLERLEVNQEIAAFVKDKRGPAPVESDIKTLETVYRKHIRPTLDELQSTCKPLGDELFRTVYPSFSIAFGRRVRVDIGGFLEARDWERTKSQHIVNQGFKLNAKPELELRHIYRFVNYTGLGRGGFNVTLSITWKLGARKFSREVTLEEAATSELKSGTRNSTSVVQKWTKRSRPSAHSL